MGGALPAADLVFIAIPALIICVAFGWRRVPRLTLLVRCLFIMYLTCLVGVTLFPLPVVPSEISLQRQMVRSDGAAKIRYNAVPGRGVFQDVRTAREGHRFGVSWSRALLPIWGNVLLLLPLGCFLPWLWARWRRWQASALAILATAIGFELLQLLGTLAYGFPYKHVDVDTVWLNCIGGMVGYGLFVVTAPLLRRLGLENPGVVGARV
jgi:glycopeptide antibiotics resistance protein